MIYNDRTIFTLNNSLAAISAVRQNGRITATDGQSCNVHLFDTAGAFTDCVCSKRAYRRLRNTENGCYTALACCDGADVFLLDGGYNEIARVTLDIPCDCARSGINGIFDAEAFCRDGEIYFTAAFAEGAYLFGKNGERLSRLCRADANEALTDFISFGANSFAYATICRSTQTVSVSDNGHTQSAVLPRRYVLRMLFCENSVVYGLFGRDYLYNHVIPIYSNGILKLPQ